jgi:hypothetical protein
MKICLMLMIMVYMHIMEICGLQKHLAFCYRWPKYEL